MSQVRSLLGPFFFIFNVVCSRSLVCRTHPQNLLLHLLVNLNLSLRPPNLLHLLLTFKLLPDILIGTQETQVINNVCSYFNQLGGRQPSPTSTSSSSPSSSPSPSLSPNGLNVSGGSPPELPPRLPREKEEELRTTFAVFDKVALFFFSFVLSSKRNPKALFRYLRL